MKSAVGTLASILVSLALCGSALAQSQSNPQTPGGTPADRLEQDVIKGGTFSIQIENDKVNNTDRHYSNGFRMGWVSDRDDKGPEWLKETLDFLYPFASLKGSRIGFTLGQTIFTPNDTQTRTLIRDDRPYADWTFVGASLHGEALDKPPVLLNDPVDIIDTVELTFGIVGPHAYGEQVQNNFHDLIGVDRAYGWDNQLKDEPTVNLMLERRWRPTPLSFLGLGADTVPSVGGSVGNVFMFGAVGTMLRIGQRLDVDYGPAHIQPSLSGPEMMSQHSGLSWYLFAGSQGRAVGRNLFLDGNTFRDSHSVDRKFFVADFQAGVAIAYGSARLSLAQIWRTKEFDGQDGHDEFGAVNLSWHF
jgi:lipid A 3-O-deacylase